MGIIGKKIKKPWAPLQLCPTESQSPGVGPWTSFWKSFLSKDSVAVAESGIYFGIWAKKGQQKVSHEASYGGWNVLPGGIGQICPFKTHKM